jgi:DNA polymerase-1
MKTNIVPLRQEGYELLHQGAYELARIEANGIHIDLERLQNTREGLRAKVQTIKAELQQEPEWELWRKRFGKKAKLTSGDQLGTILYDVLGYPVTNYTESGKPSTDEEALMKMQLPFADKWIRMGKFDKAEGTFLRGIERETVDGWLHPVFNLHTVRTYRSSSDSPNFQNFPVRDPEIAKLIRSCFIASNRKSVLVENDFKGIEVSVSACYHHDENFISYITTPGKDMHGDMAAQIYCLPVDKVSKEARHEAKNKFVFPQFYGDYYIACARNLWDGAIKRQLKGPDGEPLLDFLKTRGIKKLGLCDPEKEAVKGTFERHLKDVENDFWNNRFKTYGRWRKDFYRAYLDKGFFDMHTGFRVFGAFQRNNVTNYPVQGSAFHCLLWSLIQINRRLRQYRMKSKVVGQIHDSLIGDVRVRELTNYLEIVEQVTTVELRKHYKWLIVPLGIEYEMSPSDGSWHNKTAVKFERGVYNHEDKENKITTRHARKFIRYLNKLPKK